RYDNKGVAFFKFSTAEGASVASTLEVNQDIKEDVGKIAAAGAPGSPGDNRIANILSSVQYKKTLEDGTFTVDDFYSSVVGQVGVETQRATSANETQIDAHKQLENIRESISGVSLDEEATKMIEFQKTFDASARLIKTADEMMDTVLNLKRL
ncbi:MAG: flagellar hook-associated protein FlgK, partial [Bdellovibrionales bacterium]|nr:flagellar hook-associated protein FlgK [Bdellovibrionales bacterium]